MGGRSPFGHEGKMALDSKSFGVLLGPFVTSCHLFHENGKLPLFSRFLFPLFRGFIDGVSSSEADIADDNTKTLALN
jgi:hypothetical protein